MQTDLTRNPSKPVRLDLPAEEIGRLEEAARYRGINTKASYARQVLIEQIRADLRRKAEEVGPPR